MDAWRKGLMNAIEALAPQLHHEATLLTHTGSQAELQTARAVW